MPASEQAGASAAMLVNRIGMPLVEVVRVGGERVDASAEVPNWGASRDGVDHVEQPGVVHDQAHHREHRVVNHARLARDILMVPLVKTRGTYRLMDVGQKIRIEESRQAKRVLLAEGAPHGR